VLDEIVSLLIETSKIIVLVAALMVIVEFLELKFKDKINELITKKPINQYVVASLLGGIPGCVDAFFIVSLYTHGLVGFGGLTATMLSTAGDEAFIMLLMIPDSALLIFVICMILGIAGGFFADKIASAINLKTCQPCAIEVHEEDLDSAHFLREHLYDHILKRHVPKMFMWIFFTLLAVNWLTAEFDIEPVISAMPKFALIILAALVGIIPESGPHLLFVILYSRGIIPFSVLLVNTLSQDGHGLLPLLSHSVKDTMYVQVSTTLFSLAVGIVLFLAGL
jgi:hypothetical protein